MITLYVIEGESGDYADRASWVVAGSTDKAAVEAYLQKLRDRAEELGFNHASYSNNQDWEKMRDLDKYFRYDSSTGTTYDMFEYPYLEKES